MAIARVQYRRKLAGAPSIGQHDVYSAAWFETADPAIMTSGVRTLIGYLFDGLAGSGTNAWQALGQFDQTSNAASITVWERTGGASVNRGVYTHTVASGFSIASPTYLPHQCGVTVGYRRTSGTNTRAGRSRWQFGPIAPGSSFYTGAVVGGGRLTSAGVDRVVSNVQSCLGFLASNGWTLQQRSTVGGGESFAPALEIYVDDVIDQMRTRRAWQTYQKRQVL